MTIEYFFANFFLIESYDDERIYGADENVVNSSRSTDFMTPKSEVSHAFRDAALEMARDFEFARGFVNPGRLSLPCTLDESPLISSEVDTFDSKQRPGSPCMDAPVVVNGESDWFLSRLGERFVGVYFADAGETAPAASGELGSENIPVDILTVSKDENEAAILDSKGLVHKHYDAQPGTFYLIRPDQHVAARWREFELERARAALLRSTGR